MMMKREGDERKGRAMNKMETRIKEIKKTIIAQLATASPYSHEVI
jgi:hypothetical protein